MSEISTRYRDIDITYDEYKDRWVFELHGNERFAESLLNAKKVIDAPPPKDKKKYKPTKAIFKDYLGFHEVLVTSEAGEGQRYWIKNSKGERSKESPDDLFALGPANIKIVKEVRALRSNVKAIEEKIGDKSAEMSPFQGLEVVQ